MSDGIERSAKHQMKLVEELLDVSSIVAGKLRSEDEWVDLVAIVLAALELVKASAEAKSLRTATKVAATIPPFRGDPARLQQVVGNLLANAIKLTPAGGHVTVKLDRVDGDATLTVTDTGCGIAPE